MCEQHSQNQKRAHFQSGQSAAAYEVNIPDNQPPAYPVLAAIPRESDPLLGARSRRNVEAWYGPEEESRLSSWFKHRFSRTRNWFKNLTDVTMDFICRFAPILVVLGIIGLLVLIVMLCDFSDCQIPDDAEVLAFNQTIDVTKYSGLSFKLDQGISGDIVVSQSRIRSEKDIQIFMYMKASTPSMLGNMAASLDVEPRNSLARSRVFMNMTNSDLKNALKKNCTWVDVEIIFPYRLDGGFESLEIYNTFKGNIQIRLDDVLLREKLILQTTRGDVTVKDVAIVRKVNIVANDGRIDARVTADGVVVLKASRDVELELSSRSNRLDMKVSSTSDDVIVILTRSFYGHISLSSSSERPELMAGCCFYVTRSDNHTLKGYFSMSGYEPYYLPRIEIDGPAGATLEVLGS
ncbi:hypothetical protein BGX28_003086 [Mortierella sp. GBA30]|nr:hypothetical protein BGX28_003086 [Mortierella sp. GBA30]